MNAELVTEYAKDATWEKRYGALACQPHVFGEQLFRIERLKDMVDIIVTDSPILLSAAYNNEQNYPGFGQVVVNIFKKWDNLNFFLNRTKPYVRHGRSQTEEEAKIKDEEIRQLLLGQSIPFIEVPGNCDEAVKVVVREIFRHLGVDFSES